LVRVRDAKPDAIVLISYYADGAIGDVFSARHSLHRKVTDAKGFYAVYCGLIVIAAAIVVIPGSPLGLLTLAVQVLAGVLLPSATVFLLLCATTNQCWVPG
jgi:Mn2+/Fe2+ NRAMP family transporter